MRNISKDPRKQVFQPDQRNRRVKRLLIDDEDVEKLPTNIGRNFPDLEEIVVQNSKLKSVTPDIFKEMPKLKELDLSNNMLTNIPAGTFRHLPSVEKINLENNKIYNINPKVFEGLRKLISINLRRNGCIDDVFEYQTISLIGQKLEENCTPCMKAERELATCRTQGGSVNNKSPKVVESLRKENEKLRLLLKVRF